MSDAGPMDRDGFGGRVRRYAKVGAAMGGVAARLAGSRYLGIGLDRSAHAAELRAALGGIKGPLMKVAQILSTIPDALPREYAQELAQLQANAPSMGWPFVRRRMGAELGRDWRSRFEGFEQAAAAAASLGQVHRATVRRTDGETRLVACKLQYPDMLAAVEADLKQLNLLFGLYGRYDPAVDMSEIHAEISARLREELDYRLEARHMRLYRLILEQDPVVHVPEVIEDLSTDRLLTMSWLDGDPLLDVIARDPHRANALALNLFRAWYAPFYDYGVIHGDPHLGNYSVRPDGSINLLDFGCVRIFKPSFVKGVIELYHALKSDDVERAVSAYRIWGFADLRHEVIEVLNIWARFVYAPLMQEGARRIQESNSGLYGAQVASRVHEQLRRLGGVRPPRAFVFMDRAAVGLGGVFMRLRAEVNWHRLFQDLIQDFDEGDLAARQGALLARVGLDAPA